MRVAGIDPGTLHTGVGIVETYGDNDHVGFVHSETIDASPKKPLPERLRIIYHGLRELFKVYQPEAVAIESVFYSKDFRAAVKIGEARAVGMLAAMELSIPVFEYMPNRVKESVCGNGRAAKPQVQFMVQRLLSLKEVPPTDSADALAIAICHCRMSRWERKRSAILAGK